MMSSIWGFFFFFVTKPISNCDSKAEVHGKDLCYIPNVLFPTNEMFWLKKMENWNCGQKHMENICFTPCDHTIDWEKLHQKPEASISFYERQMLAERVRLYSERLLLNH
ncbi:hypothetical protein ATANTOWER_014617 [Ataeniobius toweri]|uniref:Uncharacterized protein n=1 Tax=Ataeniobius toweri TaxID=208326 RepID=A0ABU7A719_9TELE|nr:hypothetical protein [Ataeniobius toweri]